MLIGITAFWKSAGQPSRLGITLATTMVPADSGTVSSSTIRTVCAIVRRRTSGWCALGPGRVQRRDDQGRDEDRYTHDPVRRRVPAHFCRRGHRAEQQPVDLGIDELDDLPAEERGARDEEDLRVVEQRPARPWPDWPHATQPPGGAGAGDDQHPTERDGEDHAATEDQDQQGAPANQHDPCGTEPRVLLVCSRPRKIDSSTVSAGAARTGRSAARRSG